MFTKLAFVGLFACGAAVVMGHAGSGLAPMSFEAKTSERRRLRTPVPNAGRLLMRAQQLASLAVEEFRTEARPLVRCLRWAELPAAMGRELVDGTSRSDWETCIPVFRPHATHPACGAWDRAAPFCFDGAGACPVSQPARGGLFAGAWPTKAAGPGSFYAKGKWYNSSDMLPGYAAPCYAGAGCFPSAVGIGLAKSGTSSLFALFPEHQRGKEPRFWEPARGMSCRFPNMDCYLRSVPASNSSPLTIDATVPLTWHIHAPLFLSFAQPRTKLIATVRDPLDLLESHYYFSYAPKSYNVSIFGRALLSDVELFLDCHAASAWALEHHLAWDPGCVWTYDLDAHGLLQSPLRDILYADTLHLWLARFPPNQILWLDTRDILESAGLIATFLGVDAGRLVAVEVSKNKNPRNTGKLFASLGPNVTRLLRLVTEPTEYLLEAMRRRKPVP